MCAGVCSCCLPLPSLLVVCCCLWLFVNPFVCLFVGRRSLFVVVVRCVRLFATVYCLLLLCVVVCCCLVLFAAVVQMVQL